MNFTPFIGRVQFAPMKQETVILNDKDSLVEVGTVIAIGEGVTGIAIGDTIYFLAYGAEEAKDKEGNSYWTVLWDMKYIMGVSHV